MNTKSQAYLAEMIGTFALVFFGTMSVTVTTQIANGTFTTDTGEAYALEGGGAGALLGIAFAHAIVIMVMVYAIGHLSGCHINPAITVSMVTTKRMSVGDGFSYIIAQLAGAAVAGLAHRWILADAGAATGYGATTPGDAIGNSAMIAFVVEALLTFFLAWAVFATAVSGKAPAGWHGLAIGSTLIFAILAGGPLTGAALNPARWFGPAVASGDWTSAWVYIAGPILGALAAALLYSYGFMRPDERPKEAPKSDAA